MKIRGFIVALAVLAALTATLYWSNHHKPAETAQTPVDVPPKILALQAADIVGVSLEKKDAAAVVLKKEGNDWRLTEPQSLAADQSAVTGVVSTLATLDSQRLVDEKPLDLNSYGLAHPSLAATVTEKDHKTQRVLIGDDTPTGNGAYAKLDGDPRVFTIASFNKTGLTKTVDDLRDKRLITADSDKISRLELVSQKQTIEFGRDQDQWQILKPKPMRADGSQVDDLVRAITDAKMDLGSGNDPKKNAAAFASGSPVASVKITTGSGTQELQVHKVKDDYYAKTSVVDGVYKVSSSLGQQLNKKLDDFSNRKMFDFGFGDPNKIELHDGDKAYFLTHNGEDWWSADGKKFDQESVEPLVAKLRELQATKFTDSGFTTPVLQIAVTSNDGKRLETVLISKAAAGNDYIAQRQNEPALYVLDESSIADLRKLAAGVKLAAASPPKK
jgi:hypothetical protein